MAGPIERATHLLPQVKKERAFDYTTAADGVRQILWGLFKKIVIADQCAEYANLIFNNSEQYGGSTLLLGALFFTFQIYGDFSGYSDIALGTARLFGISLLRNFAFPYFSRDIAEFWRRWHISLSTWFRDYLYIPLGGSQVSMWVKVRNTFIIFLVSGFWHGANWTFIVWGLLNALYIMPSIIFHTHRNNIDIVARDRRWPTIGETFSIMLTFALTVFAWIFFRANNVHHAFSIIKKIFSGSMLSRPQVNYSEMLVAGFCIVVFMMVEWYGRREQYAIAHLNMKWKKPVRYAFYYAVMLAILWFGGSEQQFIYFQF